MTHESGSLAKSLASLPEPERTALLQTLTDEEAKQLLFDWRFWGRPNQFAPEGDWLFWLIMTGRGWGKTRTALEWVRENINRYGRWNFVGRTAGDVRDVMVEGESGILAISPSWERPHYEPSKRRLTWPNGAVASLFSADEPEALRGPQCEAFYADELAAWKYPDQTWDNLMFGFRLGEKPRGVITTTPKPIPLMKKLLKRQTAHVTRGSTYENYHNLSPAFIKEVVEPYEGTRIGRQELYAEVLDDVPGALWKLAMIDSLRVRQYPELVRIAVGVDPAASSGEDAADTGIIVAGLGSDGHGYVLQDVSLKGSPFEWATETVAAYKRWMADRIVPEKNNGGDMVAHTIRTVDAKVPIRPVHASRGKIPRAEPVAALYEQGKIHHVGAFPHLEDQMCSYVPGPGAKSPDRMDALVWALTDLMLDHRPQLEGLELDLSFGSRESPWKV